MRSLTCTRLELTFIPGVAERRLASEIAPELQLQIQKVITLRKRMHAGFIFPLLLCAFVDHKAFLTISTVLSISVSLAAALKIAQNVESFTDLEANEEIPLLSDNEEA